MPMAVSLGSRSSFGGASMMERNAHAEIAMRARGTAGKLMRGDCDAAKASENPPNNTSAAHAVDKAPIKVRRLMDKRILRIARRIYDSSDYARISAGNRSYELCRSLPRAGRLSRFNENRSPRSYKPFM